jgi:F-type H+-transporting ATPase subunit epsilon
MSTIFVDVVSAEEAIFSGSAKFVVLPGQEGELGILPGHVPLITRIRPGAVRIEMEDGTEENVFVAGGILEVQPDRVTVLADTAIRSKDLDEAKAAKALEEAKIARQNVQSNQEIAKLEANISALAVQLAFIKRLRR